MALWSRLVLSTTTPVGLHAVVQIQAKTLGFATLARCVLYYNTILPKGACRPLLDSPCTRLHSGFEPSCIRQRAAVASPVRRSVPAPPTPP